MFVTAHSRATAEAHVLSPPSLDNAERTLPPASMLGKHLRKTARLVEKALGSIVNIGFGIVSSGATINSLYQRYGMPEQLNEALILSKDQANSDHFKLYNSCITHHLRLAKLENVPRLAGHALPAFPDPAEKKLTEFFTLNECVQKVGSILMHEGVVHTEQALTQWRHEYPMKVAQWAMVGAVTASVMAEVLSYGLDYCGQALENRARRLQARAAAADPETGVFQTFPNVRAAMEIPALALAEKAQAWIKRAPDIFLCEVCLSALITMLMYANAQANGKLEYLLPDARLINLETNFAQTDTLAAVPKRIKQYQANRLESLKWAQLFEIGTVNFVVWIFLYSVPKFLVGLTQIRRAIEEDPWDIFSSGVLERSRFIRRLRNVLERIDFDREGSQPQSPNPRILNQA